MPEPKDLQALREALAEWDGLVCGTGDFESALSAAADLIDRFRPLLSSPSSGNEEGWNYDMEAAPEEDDLYLACDAGESTFVVPGQGFKYEDRWQWSSSHGVPMRGVYAWMRRISPAAPPLPNVQDGGEGDV